MESKPDFKSNTIWIGDGLPAMRGMNSGCVDMVHLDPPFNSRTNYSAPIGSKAAGSEFKDNWTGIRSREPRASNLYLRNQ